MRLDRLHEEYDFVLDVFKQKQIQFVFSNENDTKHQRTYEHLCYILAKIFMRAKWHLIARNKYADDIFQHKMIVARTKPQVAGIVEKLCRELSLQNLSILSDVFDILEADCNFVKYLLRNQPIYLFLKMKELVAILKEHHYGEEELETTEN